MVNTVMPRKTAAYRLDERCIEVVKLLAAKTGKSLNEYLEDLLFTHGKINGVIAPDEKPLGETRGKKKAKPTVDAVNPLADGQKEESLELPETVVGVELDAKPIEVDLKIINGD